MAIEERADDLCLRACFRRSSGPRPILEPDPDGIAAAVLLFELYASGLL
jgi:hypothetical protein